MGTNKYSTGTVILCPKHAEADALRKQLEEARQEVELLKTQLAGSLMVQRTRRAEIERLQGAAQAVITELEDDAMVSRKPINKLKDALAQRGG